MPRIMLTVETDHNVIGVTQVAVTRTGLCVDRARTLTTALIGRRRLYLDPFYKLVISMLRV